MRYSPVVDDAGGTSWGWVVVWVVVLLLVMTVIVAELGLILTQTRYERCLRASALRSLGGMSRLPRAP